MLTVLAILVSTGCILAGACRMWFAISACALDPALVVAAVRSGGAGGALSLRRAVEQEALIEPGAEWERDLFEALGAGEAARVALVNEQVGDLDFRTQRWARVPRVCASISLSFAFMLAFWTVASMAGTDLDVGEAVTNAIDVVAVGIAGAAFCMTAHVRSGAIVRDRLAAVDALVTYLEGLEPRDAGEREAGAIR